MVLKLTFTSGNTATSIQINNAAVKYLNGTAFSKTIISGDSITVRYDGSKYIYDEMELATTTNPGTVKLGAAKVTNLNTPAATNTTSRYYPVQTDKNDKLVVNVPWQVDTDTHYTAEAVVGSSSATTSNANNLSNPYIRVLDKDESGAVKKSSNVQLKGDGLVSISATGSEITVSASHPTGNHIPSGGSSGKILKWDSSGTAKWDDETTYLKLSSANKNTMTGYLVKGAGNLANTTNYLRGDGTWGPASATVPRLQDIADNNTVSGGATGSTPAEGQLKVSSTQQFKMIKVSTYHKVSSVPDTVVFFGDGTLKSEITITVSNLNVHRFSQTSDSDWIVQVEAIGGNVYIAPIYYRFYVSSSSWRAVAL